MPLYERYINDDDDDDNGDYDNDNNENGDDDKYFIINNLAIELFPVITATMHQPQPYSVRLF